MRFCEGVLNNYKYTQHTIKNLERYGASMNYRLSESEEQIMSFLWENNGPVKTGMIMDYFWKATKLRDILLMTNLLQHLHLRSWLTHLLVSLHSSEYTLVH